MDKLIKMIQKERDIKPNSMRLYLSHLKKLNNDVEPNNINFLKDTKNILTKIQTLALATRRSYITSIIVFLKPFEESDTHKELSNAIKIYRDVLTDLNKEYNDFISKNEKTPKQQKNMPSMDELNGIRNKYRLEVLRQNINLKVKYSKQDRDLYQKYLISALYTLQPPVRLTYANMKIIRDLKDDDGKNNYLFIQGRNKKFFIFNTFKTQRSLGTIKQPINKDLNKIINMWIKINPSDNFLLNKSGKALTENSLGKMLPKIFDVPNKTVTVNQIRHAYISSMIDIEHEKKIQEKKKELATAMHHSVDMQEDYAKME